MGFNIQLKIVRKWYQFDFYIVFFWKKIFHNQQILLMQTKNYYVHWVHKLIECFQKD